jgi:hypothetical protein
MGQNMGLTQLVIMAIEDPIKIRKENNLKCLILIYGILYNQQFLVYMISTPT